LIAASESVLSFIKEVLFKMQEESIPKVVGFL
jgi:hypothetical protein